ncbi:hypothetical protein ACIOBK_33635 [Micromonospora chokoriensis]
MSADPEFPEDGDLLLDIGNAVAAIDTRLFNVESALTAPGGRRRRLRPSQSSPVRRPAALRRGTGAARSDAGGITWSIWAFDHLHAIDQRVALARIRDFVDWLNTAYELSASTYGVAPCWYRHPGVVRELWTLLASYEYEFGTAPGSQPTRSRDGPAYWHDRLLWPTLRRLRDEHGLRECLASKHTPRTVGNPLRTDDDFDRAIDIRVDEEA